MCCVLDVCVVLCVERYVLDVCVVSLMCVLCVRCVLDVCVVC